MALEPLNVSLADADDGELRSMMLRFWTGAALTLPLLIATMSELFQPALAAWVAGASWFQAALATPVVLWGGWPFFVRAWDSFRTRHLNMYSLIALGTGAAYAFSVYAVLFPETLPHAFRHDGNVPLYFESAAVITVLVLLGEVLQLRARSRTSGAIKALLGLAPSTAIRLTAASVERVSEHPLAAAIVRGAAEHKLVLGEVQSFQSLTGKGVQGVVDGRTILAGTAGLMKEQSVDVSAVTARGDELRREGQTVLLVAVDGWMAGLVGVKDPIKDTTREALDILKADGIAVVMLTGDNRLTAAAVARELGIERVEAEVLPQDKHRIVKALQDEGRIVAMAGDGINDAPALAQAHVGIAMGTGTDIAMQSARVVLVKGDLRGIAKARTLSRKTMKNIRENLFLAFVYNAIGIPIAAGVMYPVRGLLLSPMIASAAMSLSSVSVIVNALRLRNITL